VQLGAPRLGDFGIEGLPQERVPVGEAAGARDEQAGLDRGACGPSRICDRQTLELGGLDVARCDRDELGEEPRLAVEVRRGDPDHAAQALGRLPPAGGDRTRRLKREQGVAIGQRHNPLELVGPEARGGADQVAQIVRSQGREVDLAERYPAPRQPVKQRIHIVARGQIAPRQHDQHPQPRESSRHVTDQLEAGGIGGVNVLEQQQAGPAAGRPLEHRHHRLEQPYPLELGR
jgi:hypothetical protein